MSIRCTELARALVPHAQVTLAAPGSAQAQAPEGVTRVVFRPHAPGALREHVRSAGVIVAQPQWPVIEGWLRRSPARVIYDLYDPEPLETLEIFADRPPARRRLMVDLTIDRLDDALRGGDHFICATDTQRDLWLGGLLARRLIDPVAYDRDPSLRDLIDLVPFGVPSDPPRASGADPVRERFPAIGPDDQVVLWNGGIWEWLDAPIAVRAMALLAERRPSARLVFMGAAAGPASQRAADQARTLAGELGLLERSVFFNDRWVPYGERADWLLRADCAVATQRDHLEARFAFRTRLLDCFWAGLPIVCTEGDELAERVARDALGVAVPAGDEAALAAGIEQVLDRGKAAYADALARAREDHAWPRVAANLIRLVTEASPSSRDRRTAGARGRRPAHQLRAAAYRLAHRALDLRARSPQA